MTATSQSPSKTRTSRGRTQWILTAVIGLFVLSIVGLVYLSCTVVYGVEFNPNSWEIRSFSFQADPFTGYQWTGVRHDTTTYTIDPSLKSQMGRGADPQPDRWDLARITQVSTSQTGPANVMVELLASYYSKSGEFWKNWSQNNPKRAERFWPAIRKLAIRGAYNQIPDLMELPLVHVESDDEFALLLENALSDALGKSEK